MLKLHVLILLQLLHQAIGRLSVAPASPRREWSASQRILSDEEATDNSVGFRIFFGLFLFLILLVRMGLLAALVRHRSKPWLRLAQPAVLGIMLMSGSVAIAGCYLAMPINDTHCLLRKPFILIPITIFGNTLAGRLWRISLLMTPVLNVGRGAMPSSPLQQRVMDTLAWLANSLDYFKCTTRIRWSARQQRTMLRQKVPLTRLLWLVFVMTLPQILLQTLSLSIPLFQEHEVKDTHGGSICRASTGVWWELSIGIIIAVIPWLIAAYISLHSDHLPDVFNEGPAVRNSLKVVGVVLVVIVPGLFLTTNPDARSWFIACGVFSVVMPPCWYIIYPKLWLIAIVGSPSRRYIGKLLQRRSIRGDPPILQKPQQNDHEKAAKLALTIGKMYEEMGLVQKSINLFDEALTVWECDPMRAHKDKIGGFTQDEIDSLSPSDLEFIIHLLVAKGRVNGTFNSTQNTGQKNAAKAWLDALEIYEAAPASIDLHDRSIIFPIFSGLFVFVKGGKIQQDKDCNFEQNLVRKFVRETELHGDPVHYTRALAMQCEVKARIGKYKPALDTFATLKAIYDPEEHSEGVSAAYGTDRSAQAFSQSALWLHQLGLTDDSLEACEYVLRHLMPQMDPKNVLNSCEMLLPIIRILKPRGEEKKMRDLFYKHVVQNFDRHFGKDGVTPCLPIFKPMLMLLDICHDPVNFPDFAGAVEWLMDDENGVPPDFMDSVYTKLCWSPSSLVAELCLRVAQILRKENGNEADTIKLINKGLRLATKADRKLKDEEGRVMLPISYEIHEPVLEQLRDMGVSYGILTEDMENNSDFLDASSKSVLHTNLPEYEKMQDSVSSESTMSYKSNCNTAETSLQPLDAVYCSSIHSSDSDFSGRRMSELVWG